MSQPSNVFEWWQSYANDAWQRTVLYHDVMRRRGNQYYSHLAEETPHVLSMPFERVMSGLDLPRPVNYSLIRILPHDGMVIDPRKRPFVVVDPRAGHGPGIGGFKAESEIGVAMSAGHPCYFIGFLPDPVEGQTVYDVIHAEAAFLERVIALHPDIKEKPVVIGNCQAGWQVLMTAALRPELFGPIIVAGTPLSYWAGWRGRNPMRYSGGLLGGSWLTALASDLGAGKFDGAWLVQNFESLNPANTLWSKQYHLYSNVDTEPERYLGFEKYWGGYVFLTAQEIQFIVDELFIGNRLSTAELVSYDGIRVDLRNIRSPIVVFCSEGDNITPPPQALGWITDLYQSDEDVLAHDQTIVYAIHDSIGHLGIFVSGSVALKEHNEFATNIDLIDVLPAGVFQAEVREKTVETLNAELAYGDYVLSLERRKLEDIGAVVETNLEDDWRFAAVRNLSDIHLGLYRHHVQPWIRAWATPPMAEALSRAHPLRLAYESMSDRNPWYRGLEAYADKIREHRAPVRADNPFLAWQDLMSQAMESMFNTYRDSRDYFVEQTFMQIFGSTMTQAFVGRGASRSTAPRSYPGASPEQRRLNEKRFEKMQERVDNGGLLAAVLRFLMYAGKNIGSIDERTFNLARRLWCDEDAHEFFCLCEGMDVHSDDAPSLTHGISLDVFKDAVREQAFIMLWDEDAAINAIPLLLEASSAQAIKAALALAKKLISVNHELSADGEARLKRVMAIFEEAEAKTSAQ
ncbi:DUF3141 domain-containing protein [Alcaligenes faecalis subsp. phenolicus]|uniref:DUF3141 domain-containing protein n=2 Tax=Alcaligenes phenolicus TaxID=232846 RepID=A0AAW5VNV2_9BURK|nr:DUF3141 domain-containing protein [Alcaligenes phenolicus]MCX5565829.1 DUF3141 domain-containing protein [Alcaligenes phenolicus]